MLCVVVHNSYGPRVNVEAVAEAEPRIISMHGNQMCNVYDSAECKVSVVKKATMFESSES